MQNKMIRRLLFGIYIIGFLWTIFIVLSYSSIWKVYASKTFQMENAGYLLIGLFFILLLFFLNKKHGDKLEKFIDKYSKFLVLTSLLILLIWQLYTCYGGYFQCDWDVKIIRDNVLYVVNGSYSELNNDYFSWYSNNLFIVWLYTIIIKGSNLLGIHNNEYTIVAFQCLLDVIMVLFVYLITRDFSNSKKVGFLAFVIAYFLVGVSPWYIVPYSDATGIVLPVLLIRIYQLSLKANQKKYKTIYLILFGFLSMIGFHLKPQILIVLISVLFIEFFSCCERKLFLKRLVQWIQRGALIVSGMIVCMIVCNNLIFPATHIKQNPKTAIGWQHYVMMGLNNESDGAYLEEDVLYTKSFSSNRERNKADLKMVKQRIMNYGPRGLARHICRKELMNYGDGTLGWNTDGTFFTGDPSWASNASTKFMHEYTRPTGVHYNRFLSFKQVIWMIVLFFQLFAFKYELKDMTSGSDKMILVMVLAVIGLSLFELLFEGRARYFFCYGPVYCILASWGIRNCYHWIREKL